MPEPAAGATATDARDALIHAARDFHTHRFSGPDCMLATCPNGCSDHGECDAGFGGAATAPACRCYEGWGGADCGRRLTQERGMAPPATGPVRQPAVALPADSREPVEEPAPEPHDVQQLVRLEASASAVEGACARTCRQSTCATFSDVSCSVVAAMGCACDGCCASPPLPPSPLPPPSPPPPPPPPSPPPSPSATCSMQCRHSTCADFADVACALLDQMGCDCRGCCLASSPHASAARGASRSASSASAESGRWRVAGGWEGPTERRGPATGTSAMHGSTIIEEEERWQPDAATAAAAKAAAAVAAAAAAKAAAADIDLVALTEEAVGDDGVGLDQARAVATPTRQGADEAGACSAQCVRHCLQDCSKVFHQHGLQESEKCYVRCSAGCLPKCLVDGMGAEDASGGRSSPHRS